MKSIVVLFTLFLTIFIYADELVKITKNIPYVHIKDNGVDIKISRIQDTGNKLTDDFAKTSRTCPPFCIPNIKIVKRVTTIAELELINFIKNKVYKKKGILVDARLKSFYNLETIPGAINIPFTLTELNSKRVVNRLFKVLGTTIKLDGSYNFSTSKDIAVFCSGLWCEQSSRFIKGIVRQGYPANKIYWYRDGLQAWKLLGLTTVVHKPIEAKK